MLRNLKDLPDIYDRRLKACNKLEGAENKLLKIAAKQRLKALKKASKEKGSRFFHSNILVSLMFK